MLRCNLQVAANMMRDQLLDVLRVFDGEVVAKAGSNQNFFHTW